MKIKQYRAADMRQALRQVREAQGPDAVILSSRRVNGGVEVVAAIDYDMEAVSAPIAHEVVAALGTSAPVFMREPDSGVDQRAVTASDYAAYAKHMSGSARGETSEQPADVNEELRTLRRMLETQLATLAWND